MGDDSIRRVGPTDDEIGLYIDGGSQSKNRNTGEGRFSVTIKSDQELSLSERKEILHRLIGMEFAIELEQEDER